MWIGRTPSGFPENVEMSLILLPDRAVLAVSGEDAEGLLNRLFTNSMLGMDEGTGRYAALLSPQGKLLFDFLVVRHRDGFWIDCLRAHAADLAKRLAMFKLRSKATIEMTALAVAACWDGTLPETPALAFRDPRHEGLGFRIIAPAERLASLPTDDTAYDAHRIMLGVPKGAVDFEYGDTFVHDANMDLLHGVDFGKGCYVGQEVVSRVHHRNSARKRIVKVHFYGDPAPQGSALVAGGLQIGAITSAAGTEALAMARIDRLAEAEASHAPVMAAETLVGITLPEKPPVVALTHAGDLT